MGPKKKTCFKDLQLALCSSVSAVLSEIDVGRVERKRVDIAILDHNHEEVIFVLHLTNLVKRLVSLNAIYVVSVEGDVEETSLEGPLILDKKECLAL